MQQLIKIILILILVTTIFVIYNSSSNEKINSSQKVIENKNVTIKDTTVTTNTNSLLVTDPYETIENSISSDFSEIDQTILEVDSELVELSPYLGEETSLKQSFPEITNTKLTGDIVPKDTNEIETLFDGDKNLGGIIPETN